MTKDNQQTPTPKGTCVELDDKDFKADIIRVFQQAITNTLEWKSRSLSEEMDDMENQMEI